MNEDFTVYGSEGVDITITTTTKKGTTTYKYKFKNDDNSIYQKVDKDGNIIRKINKKNEGGK